MPKPQRKPNRQDIRRIVRDHIRSGRNQKQLLDLMKRAGFKKEYLAEAKRIYNQEKQFVRRMSTGKNPARLTDPEKVLLKTAQKIDRDFRTGGLVSIRDVIKALFFPKLTTKRLIRNLAKKRIIALHRHDYTASLKAEDKKYMLVGKAGGSRFYYIGFALTHPEEYERLVNPAQKLSEKAGELAKKAVTKIGQTGYGAIKGAVQGGIKAAKGKNPYPDYIIYGQAELTAKGWKVAGKYYPTGRGTVAFAKQGYFLDRSTGNVYRKVMRKNSKKNVEKGFYDPSGRFHLIRSSSDYDEGRMGLTSRKQRVKKTKSKAASTARFTATKKAKSSVKSLAARRLARTTSTGKRLKRRGNQSLTEEQRQEFAGHLDHVGGRSGAKLYFPEGTPGDLSKLGELKLIKTTKTDIKPINGQVWLCRDTEGQLHLGTMKAGTVLWPGPPEDLGAITQIEYWERKPHLGDNEITEYYHRMGEENGIKPRLKSDGKGGLLFRGGDYSIKSRGIVN